jgi:glutamate formiminotransferase
MNAIKKSLKDFKDRVTFEMSGPPPKNLWKTKADFVADMNSWGYEHTTLNKNTDMLIVADEELGTLKCQKAEKYGIPVYTYNQAFNKKENLYVRIIRNKKLSNLNNVED